MTPIDRRALEIWRKREMGFPKFTRRMTPDDLDHATGAWWRVVQQAREEMSRGLDERDHHEHPGQAIDARP